MFEIEGYGYEREHLKALTDNQHEELDAHIVTLKQGKPELSNAEIARQLGTNKMKVGRALERHKQRQETS